MAVLTAEPQTPFRLACPTLRDPDAWPQKERIISHDSIVTRYISPVHEATGLIGDVGTTHAYQPSDLLQTHIDACHKALDVVAQSIVVGEPFSAIHQRAHQIFIDYGLQNHPSRSYTDPIGANLGHTIPFSTGREAPSHPKATLDLFDRISAARIFLTAQEATTVPHSGAFTLEARLVSRTKKTLPNVLVHSIICIQDGDITILSTPRFR